jgi:hypothetical protein
MTSTEVKFAYVTFNTILYILLPVQGNSSCTGTDLNYSHTRKTVAYSTRDILTYHGSLPMSHTRSQGVDRS